MTSWGVWWMALLQRQRKRLGDKLAEMYNARVPVHHFSQPSMTHYPSSEHLPLLSTHNPAAVAEQPIYSASSCLGVSNEK